MLSSNVSQAFVATVGSSASCIVVASIKMVSSSSLLVGLVASSYFCSSSICCISALILHYFDCSTTSWAASSTQSHNSYGSRYRFACTSSGVAGESLAFVLLSSKMACPMATARSGKPAVCLNTSSDARLGKT